jgi:hypothetical protein
MLKLKPPKCAGCLFGAMTKLPWHSKESASHEIFVATKLEVIVSVDQMESSEVGFFAQLKGSLTKKRYRYCTAFVDHFSQLHFVHLLLAFANTTKPLRCHILTTPPQRPCLPNKCLRSLQRSMVSASYTITVITDDLLTMPGSNHAKPAANDLLSAE